MLDDFVVSTVEQQRPALLSARTANELRDETDDGDEEDAVAATNCYPQCVRRRIGNYRSNGRAANRQGDEQARRRADKRVHWHGAMSGRQRDELARRPAGKTASWQGGELARRRAGKVASWQGVELARCRAGRAASWQGVKLTRRRAGKVASWQGVEQALSAIRVRRVSVKLVGEPVRRRAGKAINWQDKLDNEQTRWPASHATLWHVGELARR